MGEGWSTRNDHNRIRISVWSASVPVGHRVCIEIARSWRFRFMNQTRPYCIIHPITARTIVDTNMLRLPDPIDRVCRKPLMAELQLNMGDAQIPSKWLSAYKPSYGSRFGFHHKSFLGGSLGDCRLPSLSDMDLEDKLCCCDHFITSSILTNKAGKTYWPWPFLWNNQIALVELGNRCACIKTLGLINSLTWYG